MDNFMYKVATGKDLHQKRNLANATLENDTYKSYLKSVTNNGTQIPNNATGLNNANFSYADVLLMFKSAYKGKPYDKPIDNNKQPAALLRLAQTCNCN